MLNIFVIIVCKHLLYIFGIIGIIFIQDVEVFKYHSGREMPGAEGYSRKDKVDFKVGHFWEIHKFGNLKIGKIFPICEFFPIFFVLFSVKYNSPNIKKHLCQGLRRHIKRYNKELSYYIKVYKAVMNEYIFVNFRTHSDSCQ